MTAESPWRGLCARLCPAPGPAAASGSGAACLRGKELVRSSGSEGPCEPGLPAGAAGAGGRGKQLDSSARRLVTGKEESVWERSSDSPSKALVIQAAARVTFTWETMKSPITTCSSQLSSSARWVPRSRPPNRKQGRTLPSVSWAWGPFEGQVSPGPVTGAGSRQTRNGESRPVTARRVARCTSGRKKLGTVVVAAITSGPASRLEKR